MSLIPHLELDPKKQEVEAVLKTWAFARYGGSNDD